MSWALFANNAAFFAAISPWLDHTLHMTDPASPPADIRPSLKLSDSSVGGSSGTAADWDLYRALREQWTHEDNLVNHRLMWLILSQGLLFTAYGTLTTAKLHWLVFGFPFFGMVVAGVIGVSIYAALEASDEVLSQYQAAGLQRLCPLTPSPHTWLRGSLAARSVPFVFGGLWLLAMLGAFGGS
ncbi:MAG: hypothetical protein RIQ60_4404 [Pseudomonadota bacterium]|jgi:hypothetical protein